MDADLQQAIKLIKSGDKKGGGQMLAEIVKIDQHNVHAWFWLSSCVNSDEQRVYCLKRVLDIDPTHNVALAALSKLQQTEQSSVIPPQSQKQSEDASQSKEYHTTNQYEGEIKRLMKLRTAGEILNSVGTLMLLAGLGILICICLIIIF